MGQPEPDRMGGFTIHLGGDDDTRKPRRPNNAPLPPALALFISALMGLLVYGRRK